MTTARFLMCPPDYFGIEYEINPWMNRSHAADPDRARAQWQALHDTIRDLGGTIDLLQPVRGLPDLVFTANAGLVWNRRFISSRFRHGQRRGETAIYEAWFAAHGFAVETLPAGLSFEGAGDALFCGPDLIAGYRIRSDVRSHQLVAALLGCRVLPLELVDPHYYHLDTCFCPLAPDTAIFYPGAFDAAGRTVLQSVIARLIPVSDAEAARFACNAVVLGRTVILNTGCPGLEAALHHHGYDTRAIGLDEFLKSGGSAKCLTLRLDGEEAASWRQGAGSSGREQYGAA